MGITYSKLLKQGYLAERLKSSIRKFYGRYGDLIQQYEVSLSQMLNDILIPDQQWLPNQSDFPPISWPWYRAWPSPIMSCLNGAFATGMACQQGTLTLPDTWFRPPFWDLLMLQLLRPNSSNLPCLYSTFYLEYPLVLSRFCFVCFKPTPLWFFVYRTSFPPPVYQDPTCTANFLYRYTSLISAASWYTGGGTMFYKIISVLVDYIVKKWHFCPKISKIRQYTEEILSETNTF